jgi:hypothetical protein
LEATIASNAGGRRALGLHRAILSTYLARSERHIESGAGTVRLAILGLGYCFEDVSGLWDLYEMVAYAASNVEDLMDAILEKV